MHDAGAAAQHRARSAAVLNGLAAALDGLDPGIASALGVSVETTQRSIRSQVV